MAPWGEGTVARRDVASAACRSVVRLACVAGLGGCLIGENPYWDPESANSASTGTTAIGTASGATTASGNETSAPSTTAGSTGSSEGTTGPTSTMGQPCSEVPACDEGQSCCRSLQCLDTCAIFCVLDPSVCPDGTVCEHGYCLLQCNDDDQDCAAWPGFTCQHEGTACENSDPMDTGSTGA